MTALLYLYGKSFKNNIKELFRKPSSLIGYIFIIFFFVLPSLLSGSGKGQSSMVIDLDIVKSIFFVYTAFLFYVSLASSLNGSSFFRLADANILFTSPIKSGYILVYGFLKQMVTNFVVMLFIGLQYPNWKRTFNLPDGAAWILMVTYMLLVAVVSLLGMLLYSYVSAKKERLPWVKRILYGSIIPLLLPAALYTINSRDIFASIIKWFSSDLIKYIPIIGWLREVFMGVYSGFSGQVVLFTILVFFVIVLAFIYIYRMDTGFYENALSGTESLELILQESRRGKAVNVYRNRKYRKVDAKFTMEGGMAIFQRQVLEGRKKGLFLFPTKTIILVLASIVAAFAIPLDASSNFGNVELMMGILAVSAYLMLIMTMISAWQGDISNHYIFLIPESAFKKMLASTLAGIINMVIEGSLIFGIVGIILKVPPFTAISAALLYISLGVLIMYSDLLVRRLFGKIHGAVFRMFFRIFLLFLIIMLSVIPIIIVYMATESYPLAIFIPTLINLALIPLFMWIGKGLFVSPELD